MYIIRSRTQLFGIGLLQLLEACFSLLLFFIRSINLPFILSNSANREEERKASASVWGRRRKKEKMLSPHFFPTFCGSSLFYFSFSYVLFTYLLIYLFFFFSFLVNIVCSQRAQSSALPTPHTHLHTRTHRHHNPFPSYVRFFYVYTTSNNNI